MKHKSVIICRRVERVVFILGVGICFTPLCICYMGDNWRATDAKFYLITFCVTVNSCSGIIVYVVYVVSCVRISFLLTNEYCRCSCSVFLFIL
jgi:hypothetical protein